MLKTISLFRSRKMRRLVKVDGDGEYSRQYFCSNLNDDTKGNERRDGI